MTHPIHPCRSAAGRIAAMLMIVAGALTGGCAGHHGAAAAPSQDPAQIAAAWLDGGFGSRAQSEVDPTYFDIRLHMKRIWTDRTDGPWLYVEQARADTPEKPYRQRVYRVSTAADGRVKSEIFTLPEPAAPFTGAWKQPGGGPELASISPNQLKKLDGCTVWLKWDPAMQSFVGGTEGTGCASTREGAKYTTSEITLSENLLVSWDRGFDADGKQVWGAKKGGYQFVREPK